MEWKYRKMLVEKVRSAAVLRFLWSGFHTFARKLRNGFRAAAQPGGERGRGRAAGRARRKRDGREAGKDAGGGAEKGCREGWKGRAAGGWC